MHGNCWNFYIFSSLSLDTRIPFRLWTRTTRLRSKDRERKRQNNNRMIFHISIYFFYIFIWIELIYLSTYFHHHRRWVYCDVSFKNLISRTEHWPKRKHSISILNIFIRMSIFRVYSSWSRVFAVHRLPSVRLLNFKPLGICTGHLLCNRTHDRPTNSCSPICHCNLGWRGMHVLCTHHDRCCRIGWPVNLASAWQSEN